jgi:putative phosphoesterase
VRVGLVSDTHGRFEPRLRDLFRGCDLILHAGDIVRRSTLDELARIAPVHAVRGNNDRDAAFDDLPEVAVVPLGEVNALVVHEIGARSRLRPALRRAIDGHAVRVVVHGHSHRPAAAIEGDLLFVNPGSAGPRRFDLPRSAGLLELVGHRALVRIYDVSSAQLPTVAPPLEVDLGERACAP